MARRKRSRFAGHAPTLIVNDPHGVDVVYSPGGGWTMRHPTIPIPSDKILKATEQYATQHRKGGSARARGQAA